MATEDKTKERKKPPLKKPPPGRERPATHKYLTDGAYTYRWIAAWVVFFLVLLLFARVRWGYSLMYHGVLLAIFLLVLGQYRRFAQIEEPISGIQVQ